MNLDESQRIWRILRLLVFYRIMLAGLLVVLIISGHLPAPLAAQAPQQFFYTALAYLTLSLLALYPLVLRTPSYTLQLYLLTLIDIVAITLLMHASGGVGSGVGMLLVISVANASMISAGRISALFAALASLAILGEQIYSQWLGLNDQLNYPLAGLLGLTLFVTGVLSHVLGKRARENELLAYQRGLDLENMAQLTEYVIDKMTTGVMVVDADHSVRLINEAARTQLDVLGQRLNAPLHQFSTELNLQLKLWQQQGGQRSSRELVRIHDQQLVVQIVPIGRDVRHRHQLAALLLLEDAGEMTEQAQQLKLAALGRLTAGIAHEIRNPLGAIHHAAALLQESPHLPAEDQRLTQIISQQGQRINRIIEDVLQLGRSDRTLQERIALNSWLALFRQEFVQAQEGAEKILELRDCEWSVELAFDPQHLRQILTNLCLNAVRHAGSASETAQVVIGYGTLSGQRGYIDVVDNGPGVAEEHRDKLFEPFFTTVAKGTGLGLYLSSELAQSNGAQLSYLAWNDRGACFRLTFNLLQAAVDEKEAQR